VKIALFCNEYPPRQHGGIGTFTAAYARELLDTGHTPTVVEFGLSDQIREDAGVRLVTLQFPSRLRGTTDLRLRFRLWRWATAEARQGRLDVFELPDFDGMMPFPVHRCLGVIRLHLSRRVVQHDLGAKSSFKFNLFESLTLRCNRNWIGVSRHILEHTQSVFGVHPRYSAVVLNPVGDPGLLARVPAVAGQATGLQPYILFVGYVGERKGALVLADAAKKLFAKYPDLRVVFVGKEDTLDGQPAPERIRMILGQEFCRRAYFAGPRPHAEVLEWMRGAAIVCLPSRSESFGLVPVEAMMLGRPVVYSDLGPGREIVEDGVTGLLCDPYNANDLASKIGRYLSEPQWAVSVGNRAQRIARERFSMAQCVSQSVAFYQTLLSKTKSAAREE
jgi:glycosyltransferase involved in cell wall biosynthesis